MSSSASRLRVIVQLVLTGAPLLLTHSFVAKAEDQSAEAFKRWNLEALPPALGLRVQRQEDALAKLGLDEVPRGVYSRIKLWPPEQRVLRVCFFGGPREIRRRIAAYASQWSARQVDLKFDFGSMDDPRLCDPNENAITQVRVGFNDVGYWSLVGQDSVQIATQSEKSLNLQGFDTNPPDEEEFRRVSLHEFGHALGFEHEHQNPLSKCEDEFNWPRIYSYLEGPPNNWNKQQIDFNMRRLHESGLMATAFDRDSIMLYTFPADYFKRGAASSCFAPYTTKLSTGDRQLVLRMYPEDRVSAIQQYEAARETLLNKAEAAQTDSATKADGLEILNRYLPAVGGSSTSRP